VERPLLNQDRRRSAGWQQSRDKARECGLKVGVADDIGLASSYPMLESEVKP
jgi:hypothetical protein